MKRVHLVVGLAATVFVGAMGLRIHSQLSRNDTAAEPGPAAAASRPAGLERPPDYVVHPVVALDEAQRGPERIVSLAPSITEVVCALGLRDRLVGRTPYCRHPPDLADSVPTVGALMDTNYARIRTLEPDLILATHNSGETIARLRELGLRCEPVPHDTLSDVYSAIEHIGELCDRPMTARSLATLIRADVAGLCQAAAAADLPRYRVLISTGPLPVPPKEVWVAGPGSFLDALLGLAGHVNVAGGQPGSFVEIPLITLRELNPGVILEFRTEGKGPAMEELYDAWSQVGPIRAIEARRVRSLGRGDWLSAGPRVAIALYELITTLAALE